MRMSGKLTAFQFNAIKEKEKSLKTKINRAQFFSRKLLSFKFMIARVKFFSVVIYSLLAKTKLSLYLLNN